MPGDEYKDERYDPALQMCGNMSLAFNGSRLLFVTGGALHSFKAVSGRATPEGKFIYSAARQRQKGIGPIPEGIYWIQPSEIWENAWYRRASTSAWGNYRISIHPFTTTATFGRGGFFIHGGDTPGSAGCIDLAGEMDAFMKALMDAVGSKTICQIHLRVEYPDMG